MVWTKPNHVKLASGSVETNLRTGWLFQPKYSDKKEDKYNNNEFINRIDIVDNIIANECAKDISNGVQQPTNEEITIFEALDDLVNFGREYFKIEWLKACGNKSRIKTHKAMSSESTDKADKLEDKADKTALKLIFYQLAFILSLLLYLETVLKVV